MPTHSPFDLVDDGTRLDDLLKRFEPELRGAFLDMVARVRAELPPDAIARMIAEGRFEEADAAFERAAQGFADHTASIFGLSAESAASFIASGLDVAFRYDQFSLRAVDKVAQRGADMVQAITEEQRAVLRATVQEGIARGMNPRETAREVRGNVGLTEYQRDVVDNYRSLLENAGRAPDAGAVERELRDARSDRSVQKAIDANRPMPQEQIDRMVDRYRQNWVDFRAETIARTETLRALNEGNYEAVQQAVEGADVPQDAVSRQWSTAGDERVREAHQTMDQQVVGFDEPFTDGDGNELMYPGDPEAPPETTIQCRCSVGTRISLRAVANTSLNAVDLERARIAEEIGAG